MGFSLDDLKYLSPAYDADKLLGGSGNPVRDLTNAAGITNKDPAKLGNTPDAEALRKFSGQLVDEYNNRGPGGAVNTANSDQARQLQLQSAADLAGVANGTTRTAADSLLQKGTDQAARTAMGTAASYSAANPGAALRAGLAAGTDAGNRGAADAGILKGQEQAAARAAQVQAANSLRTGATQDTQLTLDQQALNQQRDNAMRSAALTGASAPLGIDQTDLTNKMNNDSANSAATGKLLTGFATGGVSLLGGGGSPAPVTNSPPAYAFGGPGGDPNAGSTGAGDTLLPLSPSDENLKTGVRDGSADADAFLASLSPRSYEWKNPADTRTAGPGPQLGVIAQEMRPRDTTTGPGGDKYISADVIGKLLAGMGRLHERVQAVEGPEKPVQWGPPVNVPEPRLPPNTGERRGR